MKEVDINKLVNRNGFLRKNIINDIIIIGEIIFIQIEHKYDQLDLSRINCKCILYYDQEGESIRNHILPNLLENLWCSNNKLTLLPDLPNSLKKLNCFNNQLISLPNLPNSLEELNCNFNLLSSLPDLPNSLRNFDCSHNQLTSFGNTQLPDSLEKLYCYGNELISLPDLTHIDHEVMISINQDTNISHINYNPNLKLNKIYNNKINIEGYKHNPITNQEELDQYMDYQLHKINRVKSARK